MKKMKDEIQIKWNWKVFFIILFLGLWLWTGYGGSNLREESKNLLNDYNNLVDKYNGLVEQNEGLVENCNTVINQGVFCEEGSKAYCLTDNQIDKLENPCGEGNRLYCYRADYNVGACLNNERVVCEG